MGLCNTNRHQGVAFVFRWLLMLLVTTSIVTAFSSNKPPLGPFCLNIQMNIRPDRRDEFLNIILHDKEQSLQTEPGCLQFVVGEDTNNPNVFHLHEEYTDRKAFRAHTQTPHFAKWTAFGDTDPWCEEGPPVISFYCGTHTQTQKWPVPEEAPFCLNVDLFPKAEIRNEFLQVIANNKQGSDQDEPLCLQYVYGESVDKPDTFHFHEQYSGANGGKEGFDAHTQAPHFAAWEAFASTGEPFTQPPVVYFFKAL